MTPHPLELLAEKWERQAADPENSRLERFYCTSHAQQLREALRAQAAAEAEPQIVFTERAEYRDPKAEVTLIGRVFDDGVRIGCQALEPWYGTGVLIPPEHPAYLPAQRFLAALAQAEGQ